MQNLEFKFRQISGAIEVYTQEAKADKLQKIKQNLVDSRGKVEKAESNLEVGCYWSCRPAVPEAGEGCARRLHAIQGSLQVGGVPADQATSVTDNNTMVRQAELDDGHACGNASLRQIRTHPPCRHRSQPPPLPAALPVQFCCCPLPDKKTTSALQAALEEQAKLDNAEKDAETERRNLKSLLEFKHLEKEQDSLVARMQDIAVQRGQVGGWGFLQCTAWSLWAAGSTGHGLPTCWL